MLSKEGIKVEAAAVCLLCAVPGKELHTGLRDRWFDAPGRWSFLRCPTCGLMWLNPRPLPSELGKVYRTYYTHAQDDGRPMRRSLNDTAMRAVLGATTGRRNLNESWMWRQVGRGLALAPPFRRIADWKTLRLSTLKPGKLLDVGCGDGTFLALMRDTGWEVLGVEQDDTAAKAAKLRFGAKVVVAASLKSAELPPKSFDAITLNHVIEHVHDPVGFLSEALSLLKPNGVLAVFTPNMASRGYQVFRQDWVHLDPPRHLHLFSRHTLRACAEKAGMSVKMIATTARHARWAWGMSKLIRKQGTCSDQELTRTLRLEGWVFQLREGASLRSSNEAGEELFLFGSPNNR